MHRPQILCVGDIYPWKIGTWILKSNGRKFKKSDNIIFQRVTEKRSRSYLEKFHYGAKESLEGYVASSGTCSGDSGGPLYVSQHQDTSRKYVVIGRCNVMR